ncbi:MAG: YfhO family protein [Acidobacteria bacterium]|nr:YfhO family protein [Candidatus Sulfomarinibacter kjeldsenii]
MSLYGWTLVPLLLLHLWFFRRSRALFRFQLLLDVILAAVVGPALVVGGDLNPVKTIKGSPPFQSVEWSASTGFQPTQGDLVYQFHPWWEETGRQLRRGELPRIQPGAGGGLPLIANGQTGLWAPVMLPVWLHGAERGTTIMAFWKIEVAGLGAFLLFLNVLRLRWVAAAVGGIAWAGTPYLVAWLLVPLAWVTAILPLAWWAAWWAGRLRAPRWGVVAAGALFGWLMGSGLHPETASIVCGSALLAAVCFHPRRCWRVVVIAGVAGVVALALSWPTVGYITASSRADLGAHGEANREGLPWSIQRDLGRQIVVPAAMGRPGRGDWRPAYPYAPGAAGIGGAMLALLACGRLRRRHRQIAMAAGVSTVFGLVLLLRIPPLDALLVRIPPLDQMTVPRFGVLIPWGLIVVGVLALDGALRGHVRPVAVRMVPAFFVVAAALSSVPWTLKPIGFVFVVLTILMTVVVGILRTFRFAPGLVVAELALLAIGINPVASVADRMPRPPLVERLIELAADTPGRIVGIGRSFSPNLASRYGLRDLRASDPLRPVPFAKLMGVLGEPATILGGPLQRGPAGLCGAWGVGLAVTPPGRKLPDWNKEYSDRDGTIWSNPLLLPEVRVVGRVFEEPEDPVTLLDVVEAMDFASAALAGGGASDVDASVVSLDLWTRTPTSVEASVECDGPCLVVVAQPWAPGWRATVDGEDVPLVRANIAGLGVVAPAGRHQVEFSYHPWSWRSGVP